ncbi:YidB family protein [Mannheimia bovis]|uniref:YidB family protein n=1 Tax=Mannheimia bovis TaxID=2770636 RepID=UPI0024B6437B|nr:YidB family protein [Mannheimia bovis]WHP47002.1 YidB family protein [Mannheimia bovis]
MGGNNQSTAIQLIQNLLQSQGGVEGLIAKFQEGGLDDLLRTWVSSDEDNAPVSSEQISNVFGQENIQNAAQDAGVDATDASDLLAQLLPKIVDTLTPNGNVDDLKNLGADDLLAQAAKGILGNLFK